MHYHYALRQIVAPDVEPVPLAEAKTHLRVDHDEEDALINGWIAAATRNAEARIRRQLVTATWRTRMQNFPAWRIQLPRPPLQQVVRIEYLDVDGSPQTLEPADYLVDADSEPGSVEPAYGKCWPSGRCQTNAVTIDYVAGYGAPEDVPVAVRQWILLAVGELNCKRELTTDKVLSSFKFADSLLTSASWGGYP